MPPPGAPPSLRKPAPRSRSFIRPDPFCPILLPGSIPARHRGPARSPIPPSSLWFPSRLHPAFTRWIPTGNPNRSTAGSSSSSFQNPGSWCARPVLPKRGLSAGFRLASRPPGSSPSSARPRSPSHHSARTPACPPRPWIWTLPTGSNRPPRQRRTASFRIVPRMHLPWPRSSFLRPGSNPSMRPARLASLRYRFPPARPPVSPSPCGRRPLFRPNCLFCPLRGLTACPLPLPGLCA
jgi:hypothetical protein